MTCPFEVGKKYRFRGQEGWVKFLAHVPDAIKDSRAVFVTDTGFIRHRYENGLHRSNGIDEWDILPGEYTEPKKKVTYYRAVFRNVDNIWVYDHLFKSEDDAKKYNNCFVRLLTEYPIEIEE